MRQEQGGPAKALATQGGERTQAKANDRHAIPVRRPGLPFDESIPRHWLADNPMATHLFNGMNLVFPDGERFFIKAVYDNLKGVDDPELLAQVKGFAGQEGQHAREHERYFAILEAQGYPIRPFLHRFRRFTQFCNRWFPAPLRLAITAGAEHYTATFGYIALTDPIFSQCHPTMRALLLWHAAEELEHKAVAFDVLRATHPSYLLRLLGFAIATVSLFGWSGVATRRLLRHDGYDWRKARRMRREWLGRDGGRVVRAIRKAVVDYLRPSFHPGGGAAELQLAHRRLAEIGLAA